MLSLFGLDSTSSLIVVVFVGLVVAGVSAVFVRKYHFQNKANADLNKVADELQKEQQNNDQASDFAVFIPVAGNPFSMDMKTRRKSKLRDNWDEFKQMDPNKGGKRIMINKDKKNSSGSEENQKLAASMSSKSSCLSDLTDPHLGGLTSQLQSSTHDLGLSRSLHDVHSNLSDANSSSQDIHSVFESESNSVISSVSDISSELSSLFRKNPN